MRVTENEYREICETLGARLRRMSLADTDSPFRVPTADLIGEFTPPLLVKNRRTGTSVDGAEARWKIAMDLETPDKRTDATQHLARWWKAIAGQPELMPTTRAQDFVRATHRYLHSPHRSTRALGERGRRLVLALLLRPFRAGGRTGRPRKRSA